MPLSGMMYDQGVGYLSIFSAEARDVHIFTASIQDLEEPE